MSAVVDVDMETPIEPNKPSKVAKKAWKRRLPSQYPTGGRSPRLATKVTQTAMEVKAEKDIQLKSCDGQAVSSSYETGI